MKKQPARVVCGNKMVSVSQVSYAISRQRYHFNCIGVDSVTCFKGYIMYDKPVSVEMP